MNRSLASADPTRAALTARASYPYMREVGTS